MQVSGIILIAMFVVAVVAVVVIHFPVRGESFRDRWRIRHDLPICGFRLMSTKDETNCPPTLTARDIEALVSDCPIPITSLSLVRFQPLGEVGSPSDSYRELAHRIGLPPPRILSLHIAADCTDTDRLTLQHFIRHRCALLGITARLLTDDELEAESQVEPTATYQRRLSNKVDALFVPRNYDWLEPFTDAPIPGPAPQLLGINQYGKPVQLSLVGTPRTIISGGHQSLCDLMAPALLSGLHIGIRTHRPHHFAELIRLGVQPVARHSETEFDAIIVDGPLVDEDTAFSSSRSFSSPPVSDGFATQPAILAVLRDDPLTNASAIPLQFRHVTWLHLGDHVWTLRCPLRGTEVVETIRPILSPSLR